MKILSFCLSLFFLGAGNLMAAPGDFKAKLQNDTKLVETFRKKLAAIVSYARDKKYPVDKLLDASQKNDLRETWKTFLDYTLALDSISQAYASPESDVHREALSTSYWIFLTQYRYGMELLKTLEEIHGVDTILNESIPEMGLSKDSFSRFKFHILNVQRAADLLAQEASYLSLGLKDPNATRASQIAEDRNLLLKMGVGKGSVMTVKNGIKIVGTTGFTAWFPVQKGVSGWMGDTKVWRVHQHLISEKQAELLKEKLEPGDILFARHEWYLSNVGLPGFWSHAALYIGDPASRKIYFNNAEVAAWVKKQGGKGDFEDLLKSKFPEKYSAYLHPSQQSAPGRVIEAVSEGVVFSPMERFAEADSIGAIRPRLSKVAKAIALYRAFLYIGRPYDFNFDFESDTTLVCSEVVYKAYEDDKKENGMKFPVQNMVGRFVSSPNGMVEQFDHQYGTPDQQSDLVVFLDGHEKEGKARWSSLAEFRRSWARPKWHVFVQKP